MLLLSPFYISPSFKGGQSFRLTPLIRSRLLFPPYQFQERLVIPAHPSCAGILPEGGDGPTKRVLESDDSRKECYSEKHQATEVLEEREPQQIKTGLQSSPTFAGNIRFADHGGVEDVEPDEDSFEFPHEECFLHLEEHLGAEYDDDDECSFSEQQQENEGPPKLTEDELAQLDHDASLEELVRLSNMGVISEYGYKTRDEMVLDLIFFLRLAERAVKHCRSSRTREK